MTSRRPSELIEPCATTRRQVLQMSAAGLGLNLAGLLRAQVAQAGEEQQSAALPKIKACILIFYYGGPSHLDTFDPKPNAPAEVRGEFGTIATSAPGLRISEHLPHTARIMHKVALVRSMHHGNRLHDSASTEILTGRPSVGGDRENFAETPEFFPCYGAALSYRWRAKELEISHAALPWVFRNVVDVPCQGGGFLGKAYDPFRISGDPDKLSYRADVFARPASLTRERLAGRRELLERIDDLSGGGTDSAGTGQLRMFYEKAFQLLDSEQVRWALDIEREDSETRDRYGRDGQGKQGAGNGAEQAFGRNLRGQNLLLARRLVEAGVPFVNVYDFKQQGQNWDAHTQNFSQHKEHLLPPADRAFAALVEDLDERGLLESTLVVGLGEFGRTPRINQNAGRDHWPDCYTIVLAGGGVKGGFVYGASDRVGAYPDSDSVRPADLAATIYARFGLDPAGEIRDMTGRPYKLAEGRPIAELFRT
jgi:hypothetical protein